MKKFRRYIFAGVLAAGMLATGCSREFEPAAADIDGKVTITASVIFPDMAYATTRALGDKPDSGTLDIWLIVFDQSGLSETVKIDDLTIEEASKKASFELKLAETEPDAKIVVHVIAAEKVGTGTDQLKDQLQGNWGPEDFVMQGLTTSGGEGAYWARVDLQGPINEGNKSAIATAFSNVKLVRNFARVSIENKAKNFTISGFTVVNVPDAGAVVPIFYTSDDPNKAQYADFVSNFTTDHSDNYYNFVSEQGYTGRMPANATLQTPDYTKLKSSDEKFYFYERPFSATDHTYVIMKGTYLPTSSTKKETYYKIDLGSTDSKGLFTYYNLLRNIDYHIVIQSVEANGVDDPATLENAAASNNLCAAIETINQNPISDGDAKIDVSATTVVIVDDKPATMRFRYYSDMKNSIPDNNDVKITDLVGGEDFLQGVEIDTADDEEGWRTVTITPNAGPVDILRQASFIIYYDGGLSRTITVVQRKPWEFGDVTATESGGKVTVSVMLPAGLPESMFPLSITFEDEDGEVLGTKKVYLSDYKKPENNNTFSSNSFEKPAGKILFACNPYFTNKEVHF